MEKEYDATYYFGKTVVHIIAPKHVDEAEKERRLHDFHLAGWSIWNSLAREKQLEINNEGSSSSTGKL